MLSRSLLSSLRAAPQVTRSQLCVNYRPSLSRTVVKVAPPVVFSKKKKSSRKYSERKTFMVNQYTRLLESSSETPLILFSYVDFSIPRLVQLRKDINTAAARHATRPPSLSSQTPAPASAEPPGLPKLTIVSTNYLGVALRGQSAIDKSTAKAIADMVDGGLAILSFPYLNPPQMDAILRVLARSVPPRKVKTKEELAQEAKDAADAFVPGRRPKKQRPTPVPDLKVVGALIEGRVFKPEEVQGVAKLPTLDVLRAQIVGLLSAPSMQLAAVLSQASGGTLSRTLEGLKKSLEEQQGTGA